MLNSIRINHARIKFRDHVVTVMYERVNPILSVLNSIRINHARIKFRDHVATVMYERYEITGGFINLYFNYADATIVGSATLVPTRPIFRRPVDFSPSTPYIKSTGRRQIGRFFTNFADPNYSNL